MRDSAYKHCQIGRYFKVGTGKDGDISVAALSAIVQSRKAPKSHRKSGWEGLALSQEQGWACLSVPASFIAGAGPDPSQGDGS